MLRRKMRVSALLAAAVAMIIGPVAAHRAWAGPPGWVAVHSAMSVPRARELTGQTATLPDGRVLVFGGLSMTSYGATAVDVYDSTTHSWLAPAAPMPAALYQFAVAVMHDGRVLVIGGVAYAGPNNPVTVPQAYIYDPVSNTWTTTPDMPDILFGSAAVTLNDGRVMVMGGGSYTTKSVTNQTELFDPSTGSWTVGPPMLSPRYLGNATLLSNGDVLVFGGLNETFPFSPRKSAELYDPSTNTWSPAGRTSGPHFDGATGLLPDGRVIAAGGYLTEHLQDATAAVDIYDPSTNQWQAAAPMSTPRGGPAGGVVDGTFVVAGGMHMVTTPAFSQPVPAALSSAEAYDPSTNQWIPSPPLPAARGLAFSAVGRGQLLVAGGVDEGYGLNSAGFVYSGPNQVPVAVASVPATVPGFAGRLAAVPVSAAGSSDADHDPLTYVWSEGGTPLATTTDPTQTATVPLGVGTHVLTLTASDGYGGVATTTATVTVTDTGAALRTKISDLTAALQQTQTLLGSAEQVITGAVGQVQTHLRTVFRDAAFVIPGADPVAQLGALAHAVVLLRRDCQFELYRELKPLRHDRDRDRDRDDRGDRDHRHHDGFRRGRR